jgi:hypothetical protein
MLWAAIGAAGTATACQPGAHGCDLPHGLPWYFTVAVVAAWLVVMVGVFALVRYRLRAWLVRRAEARTERRRALPPSHSTDVDLY